MYSTSSASGAAFAHGATSAANGSFTSSSPYTSLHYIEESLSRAAAADPQATPAARAPSESRNGSVTAARRRSPQLYGHSSGTAPPPGMYVRALYDYEADDRTSLSFHQGDVIQVLTQLESGWWDGVLHGVRGWFPSNYCVLIPNPHDPGPGANGVGSAINGDGELDEYDDDEDEDRYDDEDDDFDDNGDEEDDDDEDEDDADFDSDGNLLDDAAQLPLEGTHARPNHQHHPRHHHIPQREPAAPAPSSAATVAAAAAYWIPQATPDGKLFYFNTSTYDSAMELPLETPMSSLETGPYEAARGHSAAAKLASQQQQQHVEDDTSLDDANSVSEIDADMRTGLSTRKPAMVSIEAVY